MTAREQPGVPNVEEGSFRELVERASDGIVILQDGYIRYLNPRLAELVGYSVAEMLERPFPEFLAEEERALVVERYRRRIGGEAVPPIYRTRLLHRAGHAVEVELNAGISPYRGRPADLVLVRDLSNRRRAERALRESERKFRALSEQSLQGLVVVRGFPPEVVLANAAFVDILGYSLEELRAMPFERLRAIVHPEDREQIFTSAARHIADATGSVQRVFRIIHKSGAVRWLQASSTLIEWEGASALQAAFIDVTEQKQAEAERRQMEERMQHGQKLESLGVLAGGIAHDFNNLLMGILGNADLALCKVTPESPLQDHLQAIKRTAERAAEVSKQLLAYSGKGRFVVQYLDLTELVEEMSHLVEVSTSKKATLRYALDRDLPAVEADATQLRQVVMNLVTNASEALGDAPGTVTIGTGVRRCDRRYLDRTYLAEQLPEGEYVYFEVIDTGSGMDAQTVARIFDPFFTTKFTGRGLGLAAVMGIVRGHHGAIRLESAPGRGTCFTVLLPPSDQPASRLSGSFPTIADWHGAGRVLLVDDELTVRETVERMLVSLGLEVTCAVDGVDAVEQFGEQPSAFDLVLLDMMMPHKDGVEACREIKQIRPDVPVVLISGFNEQEATSRFAGQGIVGFIQKPFELATLMHKLRPILDQ